MCLFITMIVPGHLVGLRYDAPEGIGGRCFRPPGLPRPDAVYDDADGLHYSVVHRHRHGVARIVPVEHGEGDGRGDARILITAFDRDGDAFGFFHLQERHDDVGQREGDDDRRRDPHVKLPAFSLDGLDVRLDVVSARPPGHDNGEKDESQPREVAHSVGHLVEGEVAHPGRTHEAQEDGGDDDEDGFEERRPVQALHDLVVENEVGVGEEGQGEHDDGHQGGHRGHGDRQRQVGVEDGAPPVRIRPPRRAGDDEQSHPDGLVQIQHLHDQKPQEGHEYELQSHAQQNRLAIFQLSGEAVDVHRRGHAEDQGKQEEVPQRIKQNLLHLGHLL
mmetsp:Transcript_40027/g.93968  ORF Transcript_40027/g.93968 Transcript_40027/m.93968 type:complete len:332 (+) Transcript_40027:150-1145(+)